MKFLRKLLFPFSLIYGAITFVRNLLFDIGWLKSHSFDLPVVCVGNLSTGGTGKSPMIEFLIQELKDRYKLGVVSRGYKRKTKGYWEVFVNQSAFEVGDEPLQIKRKFPEVTVAVSEKRKIGIEKIKSRTDLILLDDAFQHRSVTPSFSILLTSYGNLYVNDWILPAGDLRESRTGARRANMVVITKCPEDLSKEKMERIRKKLRLKEYQRCYFSMISYADEIKTEHGSMPLEHLKDKDFTLVTGIAKPKPLVKYLENKNLRFVHKSFSDHHQFTPGEIQDLDKNKRILTTEKDFMRLQPFIRKAELYYLPISISFLDNQSHSFIDTVEAHLQSWFKKSS